MYVCGGNAGDYLSLTSPRKVTVICVCWSIFFLSSLAVWFIVHKMHKI